MEAGKFKTDQSYISAPATPFRSKDKLPAPPMLRGNWSESKPKNISLVDTILVLVSLVTYLADSVTDVLVCSQYFQYGEYYWAGLTLSFILLPSVIIQIFSGRWYAADDKMHGCCRWLVHIFALQPFERYVQLFVSGIFGRHTNVAAVTEEFYYKMNDVSMLRLFEAFLESAPQLTLQLYIMLCTTHASWLIATSSVISLLAMGWAVAAYSHALRRAYRDQYEMSWSSLVLQTMWHISTVAARVIAIVFFSSHFKMWIFLILGIHWLLMTIWVVLQNTDFCPTRAEEVCFDAVIGVVYCFSFFNLKEGRTRWRVLAYYLLLLIENAALLASAYIFSDLELWYKECMLAGSNGLFILGVMCMVMYYRFCHPSGRIECCGGEDKDNVMEVAAQEMSISLPSRPTHIPPYLQSTPAPIYNKQIPRQLPRQATASQLARRTLLKQQDSTRSLVVYQQVSTPSNLSPIPNQRQWLPDICDTPTGAHQRTINIYNDVTTLPLEDNTCSEFHHFSVDASAGLRSVSKCNTLSWSGVDLSCATHLDNLEEDYEEPQPIQYRLAVEQTHGTDCKHTGEVSPIGTKQGQLSLNLDNYLIKDSFKYSPSGMPMDDQGQSPESGKGESAIDSDSPRSPGYKSRYGHSDPDSGHSSHENNDSVTAAPFTPCDLHRVQPISLSPEQSSIPVTCLNSTGNIY